MSTAGKVLVGVVILALVGWIVLFSLVYELNTNWGREIDRLTAQVQKLDQEATAQATALENALADLSREQVRRDTDVEVLRGLLSDAEKLAALNQEATERVKLQVAGLEQARREAADRIQHRAEEKARTQKELADAEATVKTLQGRVQAQLDELANLRQTFVQTMEENRKLVERMRGAGGRSALRAVPVRR
jgi:DNA anti-recombination protein RmuC